MGPQPIAFAEDTVIADSSDWVIRMVGKWQLIFGGSSLDTGLEIPVIESPLNAKLTWRTAAVDTNSPDAWDATGGTTRSTAAQFAEAFSLSGKTSQLWGQACLMTKLGSGTTPASALTRLWTAVDGAGWIAARQRIVFEQGASAVVIPIGMPFGGAGVDKLMFAMTYTGISGTISAPTPMWRSFDTGNPTRPNAWNALTAGSNVTADSKVNGGTESITGGPYCMIQGGFKYTSGSAAYGAVDIILAAHAS